MWYIQIQNNSTILLAKVDNIYIYSVIIQPISDGMPQSLDLLAYNDRSVSPIKQYKNSFLGSQLLNVMTLLLTALNVPQIHPWHLRCTNETIKF